jgi:hypothetical protein
MKIKVRQALEMAQAITQLDGWKNGSDAITPYKYDAPIRLRIAAARRQLRAAVEDYNEARNGVIMELSEGAGQLSPDDRAKQVAFAERDRQLLAAEITLDVEPIQSMMLKLDDNPIPPSTLDLLGPFLSDIK